MKKKLILIAIFISMFIVLFLINLFISDSFFRNYYDNTETKIKIPKYSYEITEGENPLSYPTQCCKQTIELKSLRSKSYLDNFRKDYIENLSSCYDETYFYDSKYDITYSEYKVAPKGFYNKINISFKKGNACLNIYTLEDNWIDIINNSTITEKTFNYKDLIPILKQSKRLDFNKRIPFDETNIYQVHYTYQNKGYILYFSVHDNNTIGVTRIDSNETSKYALYNIGQDPKTLLKSL